MNAARITALLLAAALVGVPAGTSVAQEPPTPTATEEDGVSITILERRVTRRGVLVRVTWPRGTDGNARARIFTRSGLLIGQRTVDAFPGTIGKRFRVPMNRRGKRLLRSGRLIQVRARVVVTGLPES